MKNGSVIFFFLISIASSYAQFTATEVGTLPERVSNNAVCEGFIDDIPYLFSFSGIDSTKSQSGIHLKSYRYNIMTGESERIADLPDEMGKIGVAASRIGSIIYIAGGYNVFTNGSEKTTQKMHRYDIENNQFLSDATDIPVPTDDHVQAVWRDRLIYLITGWRDTENIPDVQIYNPALDEWSEGTPVPNLNTYKSFGASGVILGDTIFYFGGARSTGNFTVQNNLRMGIINPEDPTEIDWSISIPNAFINGYRMAATLVDDELHWVGGSNKTYNYDGIAYDGSGPVEPSSRDLYMTPAEMVWNLNGPIEIPMDLRGIANISESVKYIAGGMVANQEVTNKVYRLEWQDVTSVDVEPDEIKLNTGPNPFTNRLIIRSENPNNTIDRIDCYDSYGRLVFTQFPTKDSIQLNTEDLIKGTYIFKIQAKRKTITKKLLKIER